MKWRRGILLFLGLSSFLVIFSCIQNSGENGTSINDRQRGKKEKLDKPDKGVESLYPELEQADRENWQKPQLVVESLGDLSDKTVVDLGAGTGYFTFRLLPMADRVIAVDIDEKMTGLLERLKDDLDEEFRNRLEVRLAKADDPVLGPSEANIIFLSNTYAYIDDRVDYFSRLKDHLTPRGEVFIVDFKRKKIPLDIPADERLPLYQVEEELEKAGYEILQSDDRTLPYQYMVKARPVRSMNH